MGCDKSKENKMDWKQFFSYYKPYKKIFAADLFFAFLGAAVTLIIPLIVRFITKTVIYQETAAATRTIWILTFVMLGLVAVEALSTMFITYYGHMMGAKMEADMRQEIFGHYQKLSFSFYDNEKVGQLLSRITSDLFEITELLHHGPEDVVISLIKFIGSFVILVNIHGTLALTAFAVIPFMFLYALYFNRRMKRAFKNNRANIAKINAGIEDNLSGIRVVKSFANEELEIKKFRQGNQDFLASKRVSYRYMGQFHSGLGAFTTMITILVIAMASILMAKKEITADVLVVFMMYVTNFTEPVKKLINFTEQFQNGISGYERFREIISIHPDIKECENPIIPKNVKGEIVFENVSFHYEDAEQNVLEGIHMQVKAGDYIALVGTSGTGKTTLCSLIPRFYEVTQGCIRLDGTDIRKMSLKALRQNIGIVQQDVYLFGGTVLDNISYGKPGASREEIIQAAINANAHEFIEGLPEGYDTYIGQRGVKLSGGQKQRLSIARVFLKNPPILIFDEATSALDNESERIVQESLEKLSKNRTTFVIAHRLSTIRNAQRILVLTEQGIEEEGSHEELMKKGGVYAGLYHMIQ